MLGGDVLIHKVYGEFMKPLRIMYDYQIFTSQRFGGVSRYFVNLIKYIEMSNKTCIRVPILFGMNEYLPDVRRTKRVFLNRYFKKLFLNRYVRDYSIRANKIINILSTKLFYYDIIHPTWTDPYINKYCSDKMIVTIHDMIHELIWEDDEFTRQEISNKKEAIYKSKAIIAISNSTKRDILKVYPDISGEKIHVVYHGVNKLPEPIRPNLIQIPDRYLLFVGDRHGYKRGMMLIDILKRVIQTDDSICAIFVGGGEFTETERVFLKHENIEKHVIQYNATDSELAYLYQNAICLVYSTLYEGFGFPILEAFDNCCPVVCTNSSSMPEIGGDAALYFEKNDLDMVIYYISNLISDETFRNGCIERGKKRTQDFSWEKCAEETLKVYQMVK